MALYFRVRDRREVPAHEALDERGILRHGYGQRVPATMRDGVSRLTDARAFWDSNKDSLLVVDARRIGGVEGNRPGYRVLDHDFGRAEREAAYADFTRDLESAWRDGATAGAYPYRASNEGGQCTINGAPGILVREGNALVCRPLAADAAKPPPDPDEDEDDEDEDDDELPQGERVRPVTADRRTVSIDAMSANHQRNMARLYDAHARELSEAWRKG